jgi:hypothetical protein
VLLAQLDARDNRTRDRLVDALVVQAMLVEENGQWRVQGELAEVVVGVPDNIRQMIERQIERLSPGEQRALEAASVAGGLEPQRSS